MTDYLIKKGHREIAILSAEEEASSMGKLRMAGYMKALADNGIAYNPNLRYSYSEGVEHYSMTDGYLATQGRTLYSDLRHYGYHSGGSLPGIVRGRA